MKISLIISIALLLLSLTIPIFAQEFSIPEIHGATDQDALVPINLSDIGGVSGIQLQINYDPNILEYKGVETTGTFADQFTFSVQDTAGSIRLAMTRATALPSSAGEIIRLRFRARVGTVPGRTSPLLIAEHALGTPAASLLQWDQSITQLNGTFYVVHSMLQDTDNDGRTDYEEELHDGAVGYNPYHPTTNPTGTDSDISRGDTDLDLMSDGDEAIAGTNPIDASDRLAFINDSLTTRWVLTGMQLSWPGKPPRAYDILRTDSLFVPPLPLPSGLEIPGVAPTTIFTDTTALPGTMYFYQLRISP